MSLAKTVKILLVERGMTLTELATQMGRTVQTLSGKLSRDNLSEKDLQEIAKICNATFQGSFILNDTGKEVK